MRGESFRVLLHRGKESFRMYFLNTHLQNQIKTALSEKRCRSARLFRRMASSAAGKHLIAHGLCAEFHSFHARFRQNRQHLFVHGIRPGGNTSPVKDRWGNLEYPDFNFTVVEVYENGLRLKSSFMYSSNSAEFDITLDNPLRKDGFWFGRYEYSYRLTLEKK